MTDRNLPNAGSEGATGRTQVVLDMDAIVEADKSAERAAKVPMKDIPARIRNGSKLPPAVQKLADQNREHYERHHEAVRGFVQDFYRQLERKFDLKPHAFAMASNDALEQLIANCITAQSLATLPDVKVNMSFTSEVTVNGNRVPDEH